MIERICWRAVRPVLNVFPLNIFSTIIVQSNRNKHILSDDSVTETGLMLMMLSLSHSFSQKRDTGHVFKTNTKVSSISFTFYTVLFYTVW